MKHINIYYGYIPVFTIDANSHPDKQIELLHEILSESNNNIIDIYCNSPYILNEIMLIESYLSNNVPHPKGFEITNKHFEYTSDGQIIEGKYYKTMISDENLLNDKLGESNEKYSDLLDLSDKLKKELE